MKKYLNLLILFTTLFISLESFANEKWEFFKDSEYCYIQSTPYKTEIPDGKSRGKFGILVYRIHNSLDLIIQITAGFNYKSPESVVVKIDDGDYSFYSESDTAWAKEDKKVIYAMKKGLELITTGVSNKGTTVTDFYSLKGFTKAVNKLSNDC